MSEPGDQPSGTSLGGAMNPTLKLALQAWLAAEGLSVGEAPAIRRFSGGQSNPTFLVDGEQGRLVVRCRPWGPLLPTAHAVDREFAVLSALHPTGFPTPRPLRLCLDDSVIGVAFYVMEHVEGRGFWNAALPELESHERTRVYEGLARTLGRLHAQDPDALGLTDFGRGGHDYLARQVKRWLTQHQASSPAPDLVMTRLAQGLLNSLPERRHTTLVHGDFRLDNVLFDAALAPAAVLDWELATLGDPLADLAYLLMHWRLPADGATQLGGLPGRVPGLPDENAMLAVYCEAAGRSESPDVGWHLAFNLFRATAICTGIGGRVRNGTAASAEAASVAARAPTLQAAAVEQAQRAGVL